LEGDVKEKCPICGAESELHFLPYEIPYFGDAMMFIAVCPSCGYRYTDVMILSGEKRRRYEIEISSAEDLNIRVIRSSFGSIEIPELGVSVEPRRGECFISTVEGVLKRVEEVVKMLSRDVKGKKKKRAEHILEKIERIKLGEASMTLIIDDPTGNSAIISDKLLLKKDNFTNKLSLGKKV
jgi:zinc finger protein